MTTPGPFRPTPRSPADLPNLKRQTIKVLGLSRGAKLRLEWVLWFEAHGRNQALTCRHFGINRNTIGKWLRRFDEANLRTLEERSRRPGKLRQRVSSRLKDERLIVLKHEFPAWGREKVRTLYQLRYHEPITSWYVERATRAYRLYCPGKPKRQHHPKTSYVKKKITELRDKPSRTGFLLHLDTIVRHLQGLKRYILTGIDHTARLSYAWVYQTHTSASARDFLLRLRYLLGNHIENIHTDNGSEFHKHFEQAVQNLKLTHYWSRPRTPKDNAILERFNRTLKQEFLRQGNFHPNLVVMNQKLTGWLIQYNSVRPHQALGFLTPLKYAEQAQNLHTMWSSRTLA